VSDESTAVLQGQLERAVTGDAEARQRLLELTRDRLTRHARRLLHGRSGGGVAIGIVDSLKATIRRIAAGEMYGGSFSGELIGVACTVPGCAPGVEEPTMPVA
jgi:hypothetical protein